MKYLLLYLPLSMLLMGCSTIPSAPEVIVQKVSVEVWCDAPEIPKPVFPSSNASAVASGDIFELSKIAAAERALQKGYIAKLEAAVNACKKPKPEQVK